MQSLSNKSRILQYFVATYQIYNCLEFRRKGYRIAHWLKDTSPFLYTSLLAINTL